MGLKVTLLVVVVFFVALGVRLVLLARDQGARRQAEEDELKFENRLARERKEGKR